MRRLQIRRNARWAHEWRLQREFESAAKWAVFGCSELLRQIRFRERSVRNTLFKSKAYNKITGSVMGEHTVTASGNTQQPNLTDGFPARLKALADKYSTREAAAAAWGISSDQLYRYLRGENEPGFSVVARIARHERGSIDELATGEVPFHFVDSNGGAILGAAEPSPDEFVRLPLYSARAAGGHGALNGHEGVEKMLAFRRDWLAHEVNVAAEHLKLVTVSGDSMAPRFNDGDVVMINDAASQIDVPAIYVFVQEGLMLVKRLQRLPGGRVRVSSENGAYESYELDAAILERPDSFIVGRVVWAGVRI